MDKKGFTLLEMTVVVMIVAVLFVLTIPNVSSVLKSVDTKSCNAQCKVIDAASVQYKLEYGELPRSIQDLYSGGFISEQQMTCSNGASIFLEDGHAVYET